MTRTYREIGAVTREIDHEDAHGFIATDLFVCSDCGAVVTDQEVHNRYHAFSALGMM